MIKRPRQLNEKAFVEKYIGYSPIDGAVTKNDWKTHPLHQAAEVKAVQRLPPEPIDPDANDSRSLNPSGLLRPPLLATDPIPAQNISVILYKLFMI